MAANELKIPAIDPVTIYRAAFAAMVDGVLICNDDGFVIEGNVAAARLLHTEITNLPGKRLSDIILDVSSDMDEDLFGSTSLWQLIKTGLVFGRRVMISDGSSGIPALLTATTSQAGILLVSLKDARQVEAARQAADRERERAEATAKLADVGKLAANIAHEISTPLTVLMAQLRRLETDLSGNPSVPPVSLERIGSLQKTTKRIFDILAGLRNMAHGNTNTAFTKESLATIIKDSMAMVNAKAEKEKVSLAAPGPNSDIVVACNPSQIGQVIINLISNAVDAAKESPTKWVSVDVVPGAKYAEIRVSDGGPGIAPEIRSRLMQPLVTTKPLGKGTGLGLNISRDIAKAHGGDLVLDDDAPHTTFVLRLPIQ